MALTVLIADDAPRIRALLRRHFEAAGFAVLEAPDGQWARHVLESEHVAALVTDYDMPEMDGMALLTWVRQNTNLRGLPVVVVSAGPNWYLAGEVTLPQRFFEAGADRFIHKPFSPLELVKALRELLPCPGV